MIDSLTYGLQSPMRFFIHCYSGISPQFFTKYIGCESISIDGYYENATDIFITYFKWAGHTDETISEVSQIFLEGSPSTAWIKFLNSYESEELALRTNTKSPNKGRKAMSLRRLIQEQAAKSDDRIRQARIFLNENLIFRNKPTVHLEVTDELDSSTFAYKEKLCSSQGSGSGSTYTLNVYQWIQDRIIIAEKDRKGVSVAWCKSIYSYESTLIASKLAKFENGQHIESAVGSPISLEGANVVKTKELIIAEDEVDFSLRAWPAGGLSRDQIKGRVEDLFKSESVKWLSISKSSNLFPNLRLGSRLGFPDAEISLPLHHIDLVMNFAIRKDNNTWVAIIGEAKPDYYGPEYQGQGLGDAGLEILKTLNGRLMELEVEMNKLGYEVKRVPIVPLFEIGGNEVYGILSYNNVLSEAYVDNSGRNVRRIYLPKHDYSNEPHGNRINEQSIIEEVVTRYNELQYEIQWVGGSFNASELAGMHCYIKVVSRSD